MEKNKMKTKIVKLVLNSYGSYLGMEKGCFIVKDRAGHVERYPLFESQIGEFQVKSGNFLSSGALAAWLLEYSLSLLDSERSAGRRAKDS
jgi:hypothetical protein